MTKNEKALRILGYVQEHGSNEITFSTEKPYTITFFYKNSSFDVSSHSIWEGYESLASQIIRAGFVHKKAAEIVESKKAFESKQEEHRKSFVASLEKMHRNHVLSQLHQEIFNFDFEINEDSDENELIQKLKDFYSQYPTIVEDIFENDPDSLYIIHKNLK